MFWMSNPLLIIKRRYVSQMACDSATYEDEFEQDSQRDHISENPLYRVYYAALLAHRKDARSCPDCRPDRVCFLEALRYGIILPVLKPNSTRVTHLRPEDTPENPYFYTFQVQCTSCREVHPNWVNVSRFVSSMTVPS